MMPQVLKRPALGQVAALGSLYDARSDSFVGLSLFRSSPPISTVQTTENHTTDIKLTKLDTYKEKFDRLNLHSELGASFLADLFSVEGSARYLTETRDSSHVIQSSMHYRISTVEEELNLISPEAKDCLAFSTLETDIATHVVTGISWGAQCVITAQHRSTHSDDTGEIAGELDAQLTCLKSISLGIGGGIGVEKDAEGETSSHSFEVTVFADVLADDGLANGGKGKPITYTLMPLALLQMFRIIEIKADIALHQLSVECLEKFVLLFDDFLEVQQKLKDYYDRLLKHERCVPSDHIQEREGRCATALGTTRRIPRWRMLSETYHVEYRGFTEKMDFMDLVVSKGAQYIGYTGGSVEYALAHNRFDDAYVLYFTERSRQRSKIWGPTQALLMELLRDDKQKRLILVADRDAIDPELDIPFICLARDGAVIVENVLEQRKFLAASCLMRFDDKFIDRSLIRKPPRRTLVKLPCPNHYCDRSLKCNWICSSCQCPLEYSYVDSYLYCNCGACDYRYWDFKCRDPRHGSVWAKFDKGVLLPLLEALEPFEELNILILGETGVATEDLRWVVPCHFATQTKEDGNDGRFVQKEIRIGNDASEKSGVKGASATQSTNVHVVDINNTRVRLIDTPGIGDTRGVDQDNKNMEDILRVLRCYAKLHGVLILLKPNAPRLTVMFRFCIQQLLTHLHRNAAENIVFGFTNTRGSNYKPGDTFKPLETLLARYKDIKMGLFQHNVYCFDSESFRYLAARKKGVDMEYLEDNRRSWEHSVNESKRLLHHFQSLKPHNVRSTLNLNETRNIIIKLTKPMTLISQMIQKTIDVNEDEIKELEKKELTRDELMGKLYVQIESLESVQVDKPRTVCTHKNCIEIRSTFEGRDEKTIIYKTFCHRPCYLEDVNAGTKGHPSIQHCAAINSDGNCDCGHHWTEHMHIYNEYKPMTYKMTDKAIEKDLGENATSRELQTEAIKMREEKIQEFKLEYKQIQEAAIQFGFFLKRSAFTPYNDANLDYLEHLIKDEKMKIEVGGQKKVLERLERSRDEHIEIVKILTDAMQRGDNSKLLDDVGVHQTIKALYGLPNFGKDLLNIIASNEKAAEASYRERSSSVFAGSHWGTNTGASSNSTSGRWRGAAATAYAVGKKVSQVGKILTFSSSAAEPPN
ncbi:hypothetical protein ABW20_dc0107937 [Dactylellina cionopaga]|nr:hypothetical protein ABW20_dc0107937 [Dactylellina cionopaga]